MGGIFSATREAILELGSVSGLAEEMIAAIAYPWHGRLGIGGLTPPAAGSGTTQHPVPLLVGWAQHTLIHPSAWNRCSSTFGFTLWILLWILLPTPSAQPALICASLSLKDPEVAPPSERSAPQDLHQARPVVLVISVTAITKIQRCPLEPTP